MNLIVCVKAVPCVIGSVRLQDDRKNIVRTDFSYKINDTDDNALEEALLLKGNFGGKVTAFTLCGGQEQDNAKQILCECLAKGVDEVVLLSDELFTEIDSYVTAKLLAEAIGTIPYDVILTGSQAQDDNLGHVGPMIAAFLGAPYVTLAVKLEANSEKLIVQTELDEGFQQVSELPLPALVTVQSGMNEPRYASLSKIRLAQNKPVKVICAKDLNVSSESLNNWRKTRTDTFSYAERMETEFVKGTSDQVASALAEMIHRLRMSKK